MKFIRLHYRESGREFLINPAVIAGVEINGTTEEGCVLTLTYVGGAEGEQKCEVVKEAFDEICCMLT